MDDVESLNFFLKWNSFSTQPLLRFGTMKLLKKNELKKVNDTISSFLLIQCDLFTLANKITADMTTISHMKSIKKFIFDLFEKKRLDY